MDEMRAMFHAIIERLDIQGARIENLTTQVNHLTGEVEQVKSDIAIMKGDMDVMKSDMDVMKSDIAEIKDGQTRQDKILESLAMRSLEQETDIRELRRAM